MRICRVSRSFPPAIGGLERHVELLSRYQARREHKVWVLQPEYDGELERGVALVRIDIGRLSGAVYAGPTPAKFATGVFALRAALTAHRLHRTHGFDVLHVHGDLIETASLGSWARLAGVPVVLTVHAGLNRRRIYRSLATHLFRMIDGFIAVSPAIRDALLSLGVEADRVVIISSGVETSRFRPPVTDERMTARARLGFRDGEMLVVSVGRLNAMKGYPDLLRAASAFDPKAPLRFVIVGDGPDAESLGHQARDLPNVQFAGRVDHDGIMPYLHAADVFVLPSADLPGTTEGVPTALLEAMACGLPVVCTSAGAMHYVIQDGENGLVVPQRDATSLHAALSKLLTSPELRRRFGERSAALVRERDWQRVADRVTTFYEHILRARGMDGKTDLCRS